MRVIALFALVLSALFPPTATAGHRPSRTGAPAPSKAVAPPPVDALPMAFEPNVGQTDARVRFLARGRGYGVFLTDDGATLSLAAAPALDGRGDGEPRRERGEALALRIEGARDGRLAPERALAGTVNYLRGSDPGAWRRDVPTYAAVRYEGVYDGIDALFYGTQSRLEYDFVVAPGADASQIRVRFEGQRSAEVDESSGDLVLRLENGEVRQQRAVVYQGEGASRRDVRSRYAVGGDGEVRFELEDYDRAAPLVIDPVVVYSDLLGGSRSEDNASAVALDASGAVYVTGSTHSPDFPVTPAAYDTSISGSGSSNSDAFVLKLSADGATVLAATFFGGLGDDYIGDVRVEPSGRVVVAGTTDSPDLPVTANAYHASLNGQDDAFVSEFNAGLTSLTYSTYVGGTNSDYVRSVALSGTDLFIVGFTFSADFPVTPGAYDASFNGATDAFVTKWSTANWTLTYSTLLGGEGNDSAYGVAVDTAGAAVVGGETASSQFPTTNGAYDRTIGGAQDVFVTKLAANGGSLAFSTYLGGTSYETGGVVAVDAQNAVYVAGSTLSTDFPTTAGAFSRQNSGVYDGFVTKFNAFGLALAYSTYVGGLARDGFQRILVDASNSAYVVGSSELEGYPTTSGAYDRQISGPSDAVVTKLAANGGSLVYSTYLGGAGDEYAAGFALDSTGAAVVVGTSASPDYPLLHPVSTRPSDHAEATVTKLAANGGSLVFSSLVGGHLGGSSDTPAAVSVDPSGAVYVAGTTPSADFPTTPGAYDRAAGDDEVFLTKIGPGGAALAYSTYLGGSGGDYAYGLAVGATGEAYVVGFTQSADFPLTPGAYDTAPLGLFDAQDAFVTKVNAAGNGLGYSTLLGGASSEFFPTVAVDAAGAAYVAVGTFSTDFPTTPGAFDTTPNGSGDVAVSKLNPSGSALVYSTYLGGTGLDFSPVIAVDGAGEACVAADTQSTNFPTTPGAFDTSSASEDAVVAKLSAAGDALVFSTYLGGSGSDRPVGIAADAAGAVYVGGVAGSADFPTTPGAYDTTQDPSASDAFVTKLVPSGSALAYSTLIGSFGSEIPTGLALGSDGSAYLAGYTSSTAFPTTPGAPFPSYSGGFNDAFVSRVSADGGALLFSTYAGGDGNDQAYGVAVRDGGDVYLAGLTTSTNFASGGFGVDDGRSAFVMRIDQTPGVGTDTPGLHAPSTGAWFLRNANSPGVADALFAFGAAGSGYVALAGDWDGDGVDTPGLYVPSTGAFFLKNSNAAGGADVVFAYGPANAGWIPLSGDWNGDGTDTIGLYDPSNGFFFLRNANAPGGADLTFGFGAGGATIGPISGDFDGDGTDTVGLYDSATSFFFLRNQSSPGPADVVFGFGPAGAGWKPIVGDWNGDGADTVGLYAPTSGFFFLRNANASGAADASFGFGAGGADPLAGDWDGR